ncbi:DnaA regulatory inactivator Hda [Luteimonas sp. e5]
MNSIARQLPLALRYPSDQRLQAYVGASDVMLAQLRALAAGGDWLYLHGPGGVGKTHLALGLCAEAEEQGVAVRYLALPSLAGAMAASLPQPQADTLYVLDGLEAVAGRRDDEIALFDFHNHARRVGARVLYAGREVPDALGLVLPDLRSRLQQLARIRLHPPDDATRGEILRQRAERRGLQLEPPALDWLLRRVNRDLVSLTRMLDRLDRESLAAQRRITLPFLRQVLGTEG